MGKYIPLIAIVPESAIEIVFENGKTYSRKDVLKAVNAHEELLRAAKDMLVNMEVYYEINANEIGTESDPLNKFRQAIAKAEEK